MSGLEREWCRGPQWARGSEGWEPVLRAAQSAWSELELLSVTEGLRDSALIHLEADDLPRAGADSSRVGLTLSILDHRAGSFRGALHRPGLSASWHQAWNASDHESVGTMLGFPACCRAFFARAWTATGSRDLTFAMPAIDGPWEANTMLRWLGVRLVPHLPCSASCEATITQARAYLDAGRRAGVDVASLESILRLPVTHDVANEVAIVSTPHFRFLAGSDRGPAQIVKRASQEEPGAWSDNGFESLAAMDAAHSAVLGAVDLEAQSGLDLGSGDGRLLWKLAVRNGGYRWHGIETEGGRAERGNLRHGPRVTLARARIEDAIKDLSGVYDVALVMPGRLIEMGQNAAAHVRDALHHHARRLIVYAYGDWLTKDGGLAGLAERAGLRLVGEVIESQGAAAAEGELHGSVHYDTYMV